MSAAVTHGRTATSVAACRAPPPESTARRRRPSPYPTSNLQPLTDNVLTLGPVEDARRNQTRPTTRSGGTRRMRPRSAVRERIVEPNVVEPILATR
jgi:hypothetical protein